MKGIVLVEKSEGVFAHGKHGCLKELLPVYDRPVIHFPIAVLMQLGIRDIIIAAPQNKVEPLRQYLEDGSRLGVSFYYHGYEESRGELSGLLSCEQLINDQSLVVIKGDSIFYGEPFHDTVLKSIKKNSGHTYFAASTARQGNISLLNKLKDTRTATPTGLHLYDETVLSRVKQLYHKQHINDLEDLNESYLSSGLREVEILSPWVAWMEIFDHESLLGASNFVFQLEQAHGAKVACLEEVAYRQGFISKSQFYTLYQSLRESAHADYLLHFLEDQHHKNKRLSTLVN